MTGIPRTPHNRILVWAFNWSGETLDILGPKFPRLIPAERRQLMEVIYQSALIVATLLQIERFLGVNDFSRLHAGVVQSIEPSVRGQYVAGIQRACSFLLKVPYEEIPPETIPALEALHTKSDAELDALFGLWVAWSVIGAKPRLPDELHLASVTGQLIFSYNAKFIASTVLSEETPVERWI